VCTAVQKQACAKTASYSTGILSPGWRFAHLPPSKIPDYQNSDTNKKIPMLHRSPVRLAQIRMHATTLLTAQSASGLCDLCRRVPHPGDCCHCWHYHYHCDCCHRYYHCHCHCDCYHSRCCHCCHWPGSRGVCALCGVIGSVCVRRW